MDRNDIDWASLIEISDSWYSNQLNSHFQETNGKVTVMIHSLKVSGTTMLPDALASELLMMLPDYVYGKAVIDEMGERKAALNANKFFGDKMPSTDGKYGELLLFALVESVLKCKLVAHKIRSLSNMKDQVKGGDGLFLGNYCLPDGRVHPAYLIGESKVTSSFGNGLEEAFQSLDRFHSDLNSTEFRTTELIVAKANIMKDNRINPDELYDRLNMESDTFKNQILVHPVLIMFNSKKLSALETKAFTPEDLENSIANYIETTKGKVAKKISEKVSSFPNVAKVFLHFFIIPFNEVDRFRNAMYFQIHGNSYKA